MFKSVEFSEFVTAAGLNTTPFLPRANRGNPTPLLDIATRDIVSLSLNNTLSDAARIMVQRCVSCIVVEDDDGLPLGIITERDVVRFLANDPQCTVAALREMMLMPVKTISSGATIHEAAERMLEAQTRHLVVVGHMGQLLGLVREHDLIRGVTGDLMDTRLDAESTFLRTLVNTIPDLVWLKSHDGVFLACNAAFERLCGAKECDILGKSELDFADAEQAGFFRENDQAAMALGNFCRHEAWLTFADGYCGLFEAIKTPMRDSVGKLIGVLGVARDITASRQAQEARERDFRTLAENLPDNIARWDVAGRYLYINPTHERTLGVSASSIIGTEVQELGKTAIEKVLAAGEAATFAHQTVLVDGVSQIHDVCMVPERDDEGHIVSVLGLGRDMTEVYRLQDELSAKERELRALAESSPGMMGAFYLRPDGSMCMPYVSPKIEELFGLQPQDVVNDASALLALNHPEDSQRVMDTIVASGQNMTTWHEEFRILHPTRGERWIESNANPQPHPEGGVIWHGHLHDITERKQAEQTEKSLTRALRLLSDSSMLPMQVKDEQELLGDACRFAVEIGGYLMAWIGIAENDENKSVRPVAQFGFSDGYVDNLQITWADNERGQVPVGIAIRTGTAAINHDFQSYSGLEPWREAAAWRGFRSSIALPLLSKGPVLGSLNIYSTEIRAFGNDEEVALLQKLANNLALGIEILRTRAEKERTGMALQRREREFHSLATNLPDNIARWDLEGRYLYINPTHERLLGISAADIVGREVSDTFSVAKAVINRVAASGEAVMSVRQSIQAVNGETRWHDINMVPERDVDGKVVSILGIGRDMTDLYRMQDALAAREQMFRSLAESSPDGIVRYDLEQRMLHLNSAMVQALKLASADAMIGQRPIEVWPDGRFAVIDAASKRVTQTGNQEVIELVSTKDDSELQIVQIHVVPERSVDGQIIGTISFGRDITAIREGERRLAHFLDNLPGLAFTFRMTPEGRGSFPFISSAIKAFYGLEPADVMNDMAPLHALAHPEDQSRIEEAIAQSVQTQTEMRIDFRVCRPGHPERWLNVISVPERQPDGTSLWYGIMLDVTERKQAEHAVLKLNADLSATLSAIPDLLFEVDREGHQLRLHTHDLALLGQWIPDFAGRSVSELLTSDAVGIVMEALGQADERGHSYGKAIGVSLAGQAQWFELSVAKKINFPDAEVTFIVLARNVTERFDAEQRIKEHVHFLEGMDWVNKAILAADDIQTMMSHVLDVVLSIFGCDRAFLLHPCDPDAARWTIPMERHRPPYHGALSMGIDLPHNQAIADKMRLLLSTDGPVKFGGDAEHAIPPVLADQFQVQSLMSIAIYPQTGSPWEFGIHQCSGARSWKPWEEQLFQAIGRRLGDSLSALLAYQNLLDSEEKLRQSNKQLLELTMRREADREGERKRIAREIHDELGQNLTALRMGVSQLRFQFGAANPELASHIEHMHKLATSALQTVRDVTKSLRPPVLDAGIGAALLWLVSEFQQSTLVAFCLNLPSDSLVVDDEHALAIFRIVQESLTNVVRHASATRVDITVEEVAGFLHIAIADNGQGFDADKIKMSGFGLIGMSERARMTGGSFEVQAKPGAGTCLTVIIPAQKLKEAL